MDGGEQLGRHLFLLDGVSTVDEDEETYQLHDPVSSRISTYGTKRNSHICRSNVPNFITRHVRKVMRLIRENSFN